MCFFVFGVVLCCGVDGDVVFDVVGLGLSKKWWEGQTCEETKKESLTGRKLFSHEHRQWRRCIRPLSDWEYRRPRIYYRMDALPTVLLDFAIE